MRVPGEGWLSRLARDFRSVRGLVVVAICVFILPVGLVWADGTRSGVHPVAGGAPNTPSQRSVTAAARPHLSTTASTTARTGGSRTVKPSTASGDGPRNPTGGSPTGGSPTAAGTAPPDRAQLVLNAARSPAPRPAYSPAIDQKTLDRLVHAAEAKVKPVTAQMGPASSTPSAR